VESTSIGSDVAARARLGALHALGVLDVHDDPALEALISLAARLSRGDLQVWLRGPVLPLASGGMNVSELQPVTSTSLDLVDPEGRVTLAVGGIDVGELRSRRVSQRALAQVGVEVEAFLELRNRTARHDSRGRPVGVLAVDATFTVVWASPEIAEMGLGGGRDLMQEPALSLVPDSDLETASQLISRSARGTGRSSNIAVPLHTAAGETSMFEVWSENRLADADVGLQLLVIRHAEGRSELALLGDQMYVLNRLSAGEPLGEVLHRVTDLLENRDPSSLACIMEYDPVDDALHPLIAPHLPVPVVGSLIGLRPRPGGPAGSGSFHADVVQMSADVATDPAYADLAPVLTANGIRSCWSIPIRSFTNGEPMGTIDVFRTVAGHPEAAESRVLSLASRLAAIAIDQDTRERELRHQANHDPLTDLANRAMFDSRLTEVAADGNVGVLFLDLDRFKLVNDTLGHEFGDEVLQAVARRLEMAVDDPILVSRFGGDEFTVLVPKVEAVADLVAVGERLLAVLSAPYTVRDHRVVIQGSMGAAMAVDPPEDPRSLVRAADTALYHAKDQGRGRVVVFDDRMLEAGAQRVRIEGVLREALDNDGIVVHFQPTVRLEDGAVLGLEALARCEAPAGGVLPPVLFIPVAEEVGLIPEVFETVLTRACEASKEWNEDRDRPVVVWVNLSPSQLGSVAVVAQISRIMELTGVDPAVIGFEVTESGILPDPEQAAVFLSQLRDLGTRIAIDDFGTGYSSLGYLQSLPVDTVKLDRSFVVRAGDDPRSRAIVGSVVELAKAMSLSCVAEGVETTDQLDVMVELGCPAVQGYVFARPAPVDEVTVWLADRP